jgi:hypothetical protein
MLRETEAYTKKLGNGFVLRSVSSRSDLNRVARLNTEVHGTAVGHFSRTLLLNHPDTQPEHWLYVEDPKTKNAVSTLCLIPWQIRFDGIEIKAAEMGIVATGEAFRNRGLIRCQVERFNELLVSGGYDLSHIQGIPYFYRQFGYEFAIPLEPRWRIDLDNLPDPAKKTGLIFRRADRADIPELMKIFSESNQRLEMKSVRDERIWTYLLGPSMKTEMAADTWIVENGAREALSYFRVAHHGFGKGLIVSEAGSMKPDLCLAVLSKLKAIALRKKKPYIRLNLPDGCDLVKTSRSLGAYNPRTWAWQIRIVSLRAFLEKLAPLFEKRLALSAFAGFSETVCLNLYREAFELRFARGRCSEVKNVGFQERSGICLPPALLAPLLFGYRTPDELYHQEHDFLVEPRRRLLVQVLFPRVEAFLYTIY